MLYSHTNKSLRQKWQTNWNFLYGFFAVFYCITASFCVKIAVGSQSFVLLIWNLSDIKIYSLSLWTCLRQTNNRPSGSPEYLNAKTSSFHVSLRLSALNDKSLTNKNAQVFLWGPEWFSPRLILAARVLWVLRELCRTASFFWKPFHTFKINYNYHFLQTLCYAQR